MIHKVKINTRKRYTGLCACVFFTFYVIFYLLVGDYIPSDLYVGTYLYIPTEITFSNQRTRTNYVVTELQSAGVYYLGTRCNSVELKRIHEMKVKK